MLFNGYRLVLACRTPRSCREKEQLRSIVPILVIALFALSISPCQAWRNGGDPNGIDVFGPPGWTYGTHMFLAEHALDFLPHSPDYNWIRDPRSRPGQEIGNSQYLYGTSLPDKPWGDGLNDAALDHAYYRASGELQDDSSAKLAEESYEKALSYLKNGDVENAAKWMGIMSAYLTDAASYVHVMGKDTDWGVAKHYSNGTAGVGFYENWVLAETNRYDAPFKACLSFDGHLDLVSAYNATLKLAYDTTFDTSGLGRTAKWMDDNYDPSYPFFVDRVCESLNLAVNALADVIYTAVQASLVTTATVNTSTFSIATSPVTAQTIVTISTLSIWTSTTVTVTRESVSGWTTGLIAALVVAVAALILSLFALRKRSRAESSPQRLKGEAEKE
jgi:hypothetical protein